MKTTTAQDTARRALSIIQEGVRAAMPDIEKAVAEMANFNQSFKKEQKRIREKLNGGIRRSQTDPV